MPVSGASATGDSQVAARRRLWGRDRVVQQGKSWMTSEVPLDGMVKWVSEIPGVITQTTIVTDYGRGGAAS